LRSPVVYVRMILTMRKTCAALAVVALLAGGACSDDDGGPDAGTGKIEVVTSFYVLSEVAAAIGGDLANVHNLTPPGTEPHDVELTSGQVDRIEDADAVIYLGGGFQPAIEDAVERRGRDKVSIDVLSAVPDDQVRDDDPHIWLAPDLLRAAVNGVRDALGDADPDNAVTYTERAEAYQQQLVALDAEMREGLAACERKMIVTAHEAFHYLATQYGLEQKAISGLSPESEPEGDRLSELADEIERTGATTVFTEELASPKTADALAREAGVTTAVLDPVEGLSDTKRRAGATYFTVMRENLEALRTALGCT